MIVAFACLSTAASAALLVPRANVTWQTRWLSPKIASQPKSVSKGVTKSCRDAAIEYSWNQCRVAHGGTQQALTACERPFYTEPPVPQASRTLPQDSLHRPLSSNRGLLMHRYSSLSDDFYVNMNLSTEMDLPTDRESVLQFFERLQKQYPTMSNFYCREKGDFILEDDKDHGHYRWCTIEAPTALLGPGQSGQRRGSSGTAQARARVGALHAFAQPDRLRSARPAVRLRLHLSRQPQPAGGRGVGHQPRLGTRVGNAARHGGQLRAVDHAGPGRRMPHAVPLEHRERAPTPFRFAPATIPKIN